MKTTYLGTPLLPRNPSKKRPVCLRAASSACAGRQIRQPKRAAIKRRRYKVSQQNPFGHREDCQCDRCQDWRDFQLGQAALRTLKEAKDQPQKPSMGANWKRTFKICPGCGVLLVKQQFNFCPDCGTKVRHTCSCGKHMPIRWKFCSDCGKSLTTDTE